ncbi:hypothetical protein [Halorussus salinisoli]|uniref:hypothetical protein n=1 Tax=Halorussus salinisoli TaxID=2558242 RepID=UPI0010C1DA8C|nr:hypothetical protein [Halorussus salinisoli]
MADADGKPKWWVENQRLREEMELPAYRPPMFADGVFTHEVVPQLEAEFEAKLRFMGFDSRYPDDFVIVADGDHLFEVGRHRDGNGNTVYELTAQEFEEQVRAELGPVDQNTE